MRVPGRHIRRTSPCAVIGLLLAVTSPATIVRGSPSALVPAGASDTTALEADPGQRVTVVFTVANVARQSQRLEGRAVAPEGWRIISGGGIAELTPGERRMQFVQLLVPSRTPAGMFHVLLQIRAVGADSALRTDSIRVRVREQRALEVVALDAPRLALAGTEYRLRYAVRNRGNVKARVILDALEHARFATQLSWRDMTLAAGESKDIGVVVRTRAGHHRVVRHVVEVRATIPERAKADSSAVAIASTTVLVVPRNSDKAPRFHRLPMQARVVHQPTNDVGSAPATTVGELTGGGGLSDGGQTRVDFRLRESFGGDSSLRRNSEHAVSLANRRFALDAGDHVFTLSPLTEAARYGRGLSGRVDVAGFSVHAMMARDRYVPERTTSAGGAIGYELGFARLTANHIRRSGRDSSRASSLRAELTPFALASLDLEAARGEGVSPSHAISAQLSGWHPRFSYSLQHLDAPAEFSGALRGLRTEAASLALRLIGPFRVHGSASKQQGMGRFLATRHHFSTEVTATEAGIALGHRLSLSHLATSSRDMNGTAARDYRESLVRVRARADAGHAMLLGSVTAGEVERTSTGVRASTLDAMLNAGVRFTRGTHVFAYLQRITGEGRHARGPQEVVNGSVSARLLAHRRLNLEFAAMGTRRTLPTRHEYVSYEGSLSYLALLGHTITVSARSPHGGATASSNTPAIQLAYTVPLGIPLGHLNRSGRLAGRVIDSETGSGIPSVMMLVGDQLAITDKSGEIAISGLPSGEQYLQLEMSDAARDFVTTEPMPLTFIARAGHATRVDVTVVRGVRIAGDIRRKAPRSIAEWDGAQAGLRDAGGVSGVIVTLARDGETHRRLTDENGAFEVGGLRPGRWTVTVDDSELPSRHRVTPSSVVLELTPNDSGRASFQIIPQPKRLIVIDQADVVANVPSAERLPRPASPSAPAARRATSAPAPSKPLSDDEPVRDAEAAVPAVRAAALGPAERSYYLVGEADRSLENVAFWTYGETSMWPRLWLANRHRLTSPDALKPGMLLLVPPRGPITPEEARVRAELRRRHER